MGGHLWDIMFVHIWYPNLGADLVNLLLKSWPSPAVSLPTHLLYCSAAVSSSCCICFNSKHLASQILHVIPVLFVLLLNATFIYDSGTSNIRWQKKFCYGVAEFHCILDLPKPGPCPRDQAGQQRVLPEFPGRHATRQGFHLKFFLNSSHQSF